jgi:hypothetical protein
MMMRLQVRLSASIIAVAVLALCAGTCAQAQSTASPTAGTGTYVTSDPLANVRYDNRYDVSLGLAYRHIKAGPNLLQGANLGGLDASGSYWFSKRWGAQATGRAYAGTSGAAPNLYDIRGPFISEYTFAAGPEWLGPHNKHGDLTAHVLVGGVYGKFEQDLHGHVADVAFYNDQISPVIIMGGHFDLNRSARWVFRVTPEAVLTHYGTNYGAKIAQYDINTAVSVGVEYRFKKKR